MDRAGFWSRSEHPFEQQYESDLRRYAADADARRDKGVRSREEEVEAMEVRYRQQQQQQRERDATRREELNHGAGEPAPGERRVRLLESLSPEPGLIISPESSPYTARVYRSRSRSRSRSFEREGAFWSRSPSDEDRRGKRYRKSRSDDRTRYHSRSQSTDRARYSRSQSDDRRSYRSRSPSEDRKRGHEKRRAHSRSPDRTRRSGRGSREHERDHRRSGHRSGRRSHSPSRPREHGTQREQTPQPCEDPSPHILLRNLPSSATRGDIEVSTRGYQTREILFFKAREGGKGRGICLVEFAYQADASSWLSQNADDFYIQGEKISLDYTAMRGREGDWICSKCKASNFRHRLICFICSNPQHECEDSQQGGSRPLEMAPPSNVLILRGLKVTTGEDAVRLALSSICSYPVRDVRLIKDRLTKESRGFCFIEFNGVSEATETMDTIFEQVPAFFVEGVRAVCNYARGSFPSSQRVLSHAGQSAIEQGGWSTGQEGEISSNPVQYPSAAADVASTPSSDYLFDASSGYYYNSTSGLYYDPKSQYHYDPATQKFCFYDTDQSKYVSVQDATPDPAEKELEGGKTAPEESETSKSKEKKKSDTALDSFSTSNVKHARKIAKDMERWAQKQNTAKSSKPPAAPSLPENEPNPPPSDLSGDFTLGPIAINLEHRASVGPAIGITNSSGQLDFSQLAPTPAVNPTPVLSFDADPLYTDWERMACLLCKRQFQSKDQLIKHQQLSDLHKQNLEKTRY